MTDALHLRATRNSTFTQLAGLPRMPDSFAWPEWGGKAQTFLAQIDLAEAHRALPSFLPPQGALYFFYDQEQSVWGDDSKDRGGWQVFYHAGELGKLSERQPPNDDEGCVFERKPVQPTRIVSFPDSQRLPDGTFAWERDGNAYSELVAESYDTEPPHQLLGFPRPIQNDDMELDCQLAFNGVAAHGAGNAKDSRHAALESGARDWRLLLQIDSDDEIGWMWGDVGTLYFWIREEDARRGRFENTWLSFQCC